MSNTFKLVKEFMSAMKASEQNKTQPYDTQGTVKRVEGSTAWIQFTGADRETPVQMTIACEVGDTVQARVGGGSAWLTGNLTAPPTDDKKANQALSMVTTTVQTIKEEVEEALEEMSDEGSEVEDVVIQYCLSDSSSTFIQYGNWSDTPPEYVSGKYYWVRSVIYDDEGNETYGTPRYSQDTQLSVETSRAYATTNAHFWYDNTGAYVTDSTQDDYKSDATGKYATRVTPTGILQSYGGTTLSSWTNSGISFYQGSSTVASFGSTVSIGDFNKLTLDSSGINIEAHAGSWSVPVNGAITPLSTSSKSGLELSSDYTLYLTGSSAVQIYAGGTQIATFGSGNLLVNNKVVAGALNDSLFSVTSVSVTTSSGTDNLTGSASASNTGYYPLCVAGLSVNTGGAYSRGAYLSSQSDGSCTVNLRVYNGGSSGAISATVYVLWLKTTA